MARTDDPRLRIITDTLRKPVSDVVPADLISGHNISHFDPTRNAGDRPAPWAMQIDVLAQRIYTALYGRPDAAPASSPLQQAEDAKRRRDIVGEIDALMSAGADLESAPWYPALPGDVVHVHYEQASSMAAFGETYIIRDAGDGLLRMQLLAHTLADAADAAGATGCFVVEAADDPLYELWFEGGPHRLTIVRHGRVVHDGPGRPALHR